MEQISKLSYLQYNLKETAYVAQNQCYREYLKSLQMGGKASCVQRNNDRDHFIFLIRNDVKKTVEDIFTERKELST